MKKYSLSLLLILSVSINYCTAQLSHVWSNGMGGSTSDFGSAIASDNSGNVYVAGTFTGTVDFDPSGNVTNLSSNGGSVDIFLAKYDASGNFVWVKQIAGSNDEQPYDIYVDANHIYLVGIFKGTVDFDPGVGTNSYVCNGGGTDGDGFFGKYDLNGNHVWAYRIGGSGNDRILGVTVDGSGNVFLCGFTSNTTDMDPGPSVVNHISSLYNSFFGKYTSAGAYVFSKQLTGDYSEPSDIQLDGSGNIYLAGDWSQSVDFDPSGANAIMTTSGAVQIDAYFAKYTSLGAYTFAKRIGGIGVDYALQIALDVNNNIYVGGLFSSTCDFDPAAPVVSLVSAGGSDGFYAKYDNAGLYTYAYGFGGTSNDYVNALKLDASSNIVLGGKFTGTNIDFDPGGGASLLTGASTAYIAGYTSAGAYSFAYSFGNAAGELKGMSVSSSIYVTGFFTGTVDFDFSGNVVNEVSNGGNDIFFAKYNNCVGAPPAQPGAISGAISVCPGTSQTYSISPVVGATSYTWTLPVGWTGSSITNSINATTGANSGTISVTANNTCGPGIAQTLAVTVNPTYTINNTASICQGDSVLLAGLYRKIAGTYTTNLLTAKGCDSTIITVLTVNPLPGITISGITTICNGLSTSLTANGANTYLWQPGNLSGATQVLSPANTTTYTITGTALSGCINTTTVTVTVNPTYSITTNTGICQGDSILLAGAYRKTAGTYIDNALTVNGCDSNTTTTLVVNPIPTVTLSQFTAVCADAAIYTLTGGLPAGGTYSGTGVTNNQFNPAIAGAGTHTITYNYTDVNTGCSNFATNTILVYPSPPVPTISVNGTTLTSSAASGNQWYLNGSAINGATNNSLVCTVNGNYMVCVTDANGCKSCSAVLSFTTIGISEDKNWNEVNIYPNPFSTEVTLTPIAIGVSKGEVLAIIYNTLGEIIYSTQLIAQPFTINLGDVPKGIYFLQLKNENEIVTKKIIKQ